jgi:2-oxoglutarate ferredoxin oxidoreductase subunit gamma
MIERIIMAGFGGQGVMTIGKMLAQVAMDRGLQVTFIPAYGPEVRGGTAHCEVALSDEPIASPLVEQADTLILLNQPSYDKFRPLLKPDGVALLNNSMIKPFAGDTRSMLIPATEAANELGNVRVTNLVILGAYAQLRGGVPIEAIMGVLGKEFTGKRSHLLEANRLAFLKGKELAQKAGENFPS